MSARLRIVKPDDDLYPEDFTATVERKAVWHPFIVAALVFLFVLACVAWVVAEAHRS